MKRIANIFLILFLLTAIASLLNASLMLFDYAIVPRLLLQLGWWSVYLCAAILYIGYGFNRHLPKVLLIPLQLSLLWRLLSYWPLEEMVGPHYAIYASVTQLILILIILQINKLSNGKSRLLMTKQFSGPAFSGGRLLKFLLANIVLTPLLLFLSGFSLAAHLIEEGTAGFVRLKPNGLYMIERTYHRDNKQIQMMGMIHLAQSHYYNNLLLTIPEKKTLILLEGVSDRKGLLKERFDYDKIAAMLGLQSQRMLRFQGRLINKNRLKIKEKAANLEIDLLPADIDISRFDPITLKALNALAKYILNAENPLAGYIDFTRWAEQHTGSDFNKTLMNDLLDKRNSHLLSFLPAALAKYDNLVLPWGALHMKELEKAIVDQGFSLSRSREHLSIDFLLLPFGHLWEKSTSLLNTNRFGFRKMVSKWIDTTKQASCLQH